MDSLLYRTHWCFWLNCLLAFYKNMSNCYRLLINRCHQHPITTLSPTFLYIISNFVSFMYNTTETTMTLKRKRLTMLISHARISVLISFILPSTGPLFIKRTGVLSQDLVKSRSREIRVKTFPSALKFDRHLGSSAAEMPTKFQSDTIIATSSLAAYQVRKFTGCECAGNSGNVFPATVG